jgi:hypothetical protein
MSSENGLCPICLETIYSSKKCHLTDCHHLFHQECYYQFIKKNEYLCPLRCIKKNQNDMINLSFHLIKKIKDINGLNINIMSLIKSINWQQNKTFISGSFAYSLYHDLKYSFNDIDVFTNTTDNININHLINYNYNIINSKNVVINYRDYDYCSNNTIHNKVYKFIKKNEYCNDDLYLSITDTNVYDFDLIVYEHQSFSLEDNIKYIFDGFDLAINKIAFTYLENDTFLFYIDPDFYSNNVYVCKNDIRKNKTIQRIEKYKKRKILTEFNLKNCRFCK